MWSLLHGLLGKDVHVMNRTNTSTIIETEVNRLLNAGMSDKKEIISKVVERTGLPRPTIRRVIRDMKVDLLRKLQILQSDDIPLPEIPTDYDK